MSYIWFFLGVIVGQSLVVMASYIGEILKDRREEIEEHERFKDELHRTR